MTLPVLIKPARAFPLNVVHAVRCHIKQAQVAADQGKGYLKLATGVAVPIGTIPAGSFVFEGWKHVITIFDGTTPALEVGDSVDPDGFATSALIAPGAVAYAGGIKGALTGFVAADTVVYAKLTAAGNAAGEADIVIPYYHAKD